MKINKINNNVISKDINDNKCLVIK